MEIRMVDLQGQYQNIKGEMDKAIQNVINDSAFIKGKYVKSFKENLEKYLQVKHVIPCGNGTDALQLALMAMDYEKGSEVITSSFTFVATVEVICLLGLKPVFVDIDPQTFNLDARLIEQAITEKTKCILPVHLFGQAADMSAIMELASRRKIHVIEDTAQAISATYIHDNTSSYCGTIGDIGTLSFFPSKNLGCYGDGGAVLTNNDDLAYKMNLYANHGSLKKYYYESIGINSRLDGMQAAILDVKLRHLDTYVSQRQKAAALYDELLKETSQVITPHRIEAGNHVFHQYTIRIHDHRDKITAAFKEKGIPFGIYYPEPLHKQGIYTKFARDTTALPETDRACKEVLSLPMHTELTAEMQGFVCDTIKNTLQDC